MNVPAGMANDRVALNQPPVVTMPIVNQQTVIPDNPTFVLSLVVFPSVSPPGGSPAEESYTFSGCPTLVITGSPNPATTLAMSFVDTPIVYNPARDGYYLFPMSLYLAGNPIISSPTYTLPVTKTIGKYVLVSLNRAVGDTAVYSLAPASFVRVQKTI